MIVGEEVAKVSDSPPGCTLQNEAYAAVIDNTVFWIYDTAGLDDGDQGRVPHWKAIQNLYTLIQELDGVSLLIYCMRGKFKKNATVNWNLFNKVICGEKVPIVAVVTGLEGREDPDDWWRDEDHRKAFRKNKMGPLDVCCVVSFRGRNDEHAEVYTESRRKLRDFIWKNHLRAPWSKEKDEWFSDIYQNVYSAGLCFVSQSRLEYSTTMQRMIDEFVKETGIEEEDSKNLKATLLKAERKLLKAERKRGFLSKK